MSLAGLVLYPTYSGAPLPPRISSGNAQPMSELPTLSEAAAPPVTQRHHAPRRRPPGQPHTTLANRIKRMNQSRPGGGQQYVNMMPPSSAVYGAVSMPSPPVPFAASGAPPPAHRPAPVDHQFRATSQRHVGQNVPRRQAPKPPRTSYGVEYTSAAATEIARTIERQSLAASAMAPDPTTPNSRPVSAASSRSRSAAQGAFYPTVFHLAKRGNSGRVDARAIGAKKEMSHTEMLYYLRHGVHPRPSGGGGGHSGGGGASMPPSPQLNEEDATALAVSRRRVLGFVRAREDALRSVYSSVPHPTDEASLRSITQRLLADKAVQGELRRQLGRALHTLRVASAACVRAIHEWRAELRARDGARYASLPEHEVSFAYNGVDYLRKMATDLHFLPAPILADPLLLDWFRHALPWLTSADGGLGLVVGDAPSPGPGYGGGGGGGGGGGASGMVGAPPAGRAGVRPSSASVRFAPEAPTPTKRPTSAKSMDQSPYGTPSQRAPPKQPGSWLGGRPAPAPGWRERPNAGPAAFVDAARELAPLFAPRGAAEEGEEVAWDADLASEEEDEWLRGAQEALLNESRLRGENVSPEAAVQMARRTGVGHATRHAEWRWGAFQLLLYGSETYLRLVAALPAFANSDAAIATRAAVAKRAYVVRLHVGGGKVRAKIGASHPANAP